jgi:hypothetical protein
MKCHPVGALWLLLSATFGCGDHEVVGFPITDVVAPTVDTTTPDRGDVDVAINTAITATFSEGMEPSTVDGDTVTLVQGAVEVQATVAYVGLTAVLIPRRVLENDTVYTGRVTRGATDLAGNALVDDHVWSFTTGDETDITPPEVISTLPLNGAAEVSPSTAVVATFSERMDPRTINDATFSVRLGSDLVDGTVTHVGAVAIFDPAQRLQADGAYTATVTTGASDLAGNGLAADFTWSFQVGSGVDEEPPVVVSTVPDDGEIDVFATAALTATFSEPLNPVTMNPGTFQLKGPDLVLVPGTVHYDVSGPSGRFVPDAPLMDDAVYVATITTGVADLSGNSMARGYVWSFTTSPPIDTTRPFVVLTNPSDAAQGVRNDTDIQAAFSERMNPATLTSSTFSVTGAGGLPVAGTIVNDPLGSVVTFTPVVDLTPGVAYTGTIAAGVADLVGNTLGADYVWTFTTRGLADVIPPTVILTSPADDAFAVQPEATVGAAFSEAMAPATLTAATFYLTGAGGVVVPGVVVYDAVSPVATFVPNDDLDGAVLYTATITTGVTDVAGNAMVADHVWTFRTRLGPDSTPPTVILTSPADGAYGVAHDATIGAAFSEPMNPFTLTEITFRVFAPGAVPVLGTVSYDPTSPVAIFLPATDLLPDTDYLALITTGATDTSGNGLAAEYRWNFTTGGPFDDVAPTVVQTMPDDGELDVPVDADITVMFSEAMDPLTLGSGTFFIDGPGPLPVLGTLSYDAFAYSVTFVPAAPLREDFDYTAYVTTDATDVAGNPLAAEVSWTFTTVAPSSALQPVDLGSLSEFVVAAGGGLMNSNVSGLTTLNGDVGLYPDPTCLGDGVPCTLTNPVINGALFAADASGFAEQAMDDLDAARMDAATRLPGTLVSDLSGQTLTPGVYTSLATMSIGVSGILVLDAEGDPDAVWIFQAGSSLTLSNNAQVLLVNGAQAKNVFWSVFTSSTLGSNVSLQGTILAGGANSVGMDSVIVGRVLCKTGAITLLSNHITLPPI